jgi:hypothetical protein
MCAHFDCFESSVQHAVAVKIDFAAVGRLQKAVVVEPFAHPGLRRLLMGLHVTAKLAHIVLELAPDRVKGLPDSRRETLLHLPVRHQFLARHR